MNKQATAKAAAKLRRLQRAVDGMKSAESPEAIEEAWGDFIMAAGTIYSTLEQGSKTNSESRG